MLHVHVVMIFLDIFMHVTLETELIWAMLINQNFLGILHIICPLLIFAKIVIYIVSKSMCSF